MPSPTRIRPTTIGALLGRVELGDEEASNIGVEPPWVVAAGGGSWPMGGRGQGWPWVFKGRRTSGSPWKTTNSLSHRGGRGRGPPWRAVKRAGGGRTPVG